MSTEADQARSQAFASWVQEAGSAEKPSDEPRPNLQPPQQQLLAEHHLMGAVLFAMEEEARRLLAGNPLQPEFWNDVVDFIGNFTHQVHREKEERIYFPALEAWGVLEPEVCQRLEEDHARLREMTVLLCEAITEGDWEKAFRVVSMYLGRMRSHLHTEEELLLSPELEEVSEKQIASLLARFAAVEDERLGAGGRAHYLDVARSLCRAAGIEEGLAG